MACRTLPPTVLGFLAFVSTAGTLHAQTPQWTARFNDVAFARDAVSAVAAGPDGSAYLAGFNDSGWVAWKVAVDGRIEWFWHQAGLLHFSDEDPRIAGLDATGHLFLVAGSGPGLSNFGITIARIAPDGQSALVRHHDVQANLGDAAVTATGDLFVTGSVYVVSPPSFSDVYVARFDREGELVWTATYDGPASDADNGAALALMPSGDVYVAGRAAYRSVSTNRICHAGLVLRYTPDGERLWDSLTQLDPAAPEESLSGFTIVVDSAGDAYVGGCKSSNVPTAPNPRGLIFKVASDGTPLWHDGPLDYLNTTDASRDPRVLLDEQRGAVYLANDVWISDTDRDLRLRRYTPDGVAVWSVGYDGPAHSYDNLIDAGLDAAGRVHLIGTTYSAVDNPDLTDVQFDSDGQVVIVGRSDNEASKYDRVRVGAVDHDGHALMVGGAFGEYFDSRVVRMSPEGQIDWNIVLQTTVGSFDSFSCMATDASGDIYAAGISDRRRPENSSVLMRYSAGGALQWQQRLPEGYQNPQAVLVDPLGNAVVLVEHLSSSEWLGLLRYAPDGMLESAQHYAGPEPGSWRRAGVAIDPQGNFFICGSVEYRDANGHSDYDAVVVCIAADGAARWSQTLSGARSEQFYALATDESGGVTVTGSSVDYSGGSPSYTITIRYGPNGFEQWRQIYTATYPTTGDGPRSVEVAADGAAFVTTNRGVVFAHRSIAVLNYSADGALRWVRDFFAPEGIWILAVESRLDSNGNLVVLCSLQRAADRTYDILLLCYSPDGDLRWQHRHPGPLNYSELPRMLEVSPTGDPLVSAIFFPGLDREYYNSMLLRLDSNGNPRWMSRQSLPAELAGQVNALLATPDGGFVTAGETWSAETREDAILVRYGPPAASCPAVDSCPGDLNADCRLDLADLTIVLAAFGNVRAEGFAPQNGDIDFDGDVDLQDLAVVLSAWGSDCR